MATEYTAPNPDAPPSPVAMDDVLAAAARLERVARRTPAMRSDALDEAAGARVTLKCENFQRVGAFKFRGAYNALASLGDEARDRGVLTYSSGNHAQAVALAGRLLGIRTTIVMPEDAPALKRRATEGYLGEGSEVIPYDRQRVTREELGARLVEERGLTLVPPYDHPEVIAGQATVALELIEQMSCADGPPDELYVCCGGGGLLSGCAIAASNLVPGCRVVGVEPEAGDDATRSFRDRRLHTVHNPATIADGARTPSLGRWTFPLVLAHVDGMLTVSDGELVAAMRWLFERMKIVAEPSGVLGLAGLLRAARERAGAPTPGRRVGVVISGGNVDAETFARLVLDA